VANFATEADVRLKIQLEDTELASAALINARLDDAHREILQRLDPSVDPGVPPDAVVAGETLLAGAFVLASAAARTSANRVEVRVGGQRIETGQRFAALMTLSEKFEGEAWRVLAPFLKSQPGRNLAAPTDSVPVLGEGAD